MISRCCKQDVFAMVGYYTCSVCHFPCDIVSIGLNEKDYRHDARHENQVKNSFDSA
jgi:hypothetical protein